MNESFQARKKKEVCSSYILTRVYRPPDALASNKLFKTPRTAYEEFLFEKCVTKIHYDHASKNNPNVCVKLENKIAGYSSLVS